MAITKNQRADSLKGKVFVPKIPGTPGGYIYVRDARGGRISFSVMEHYTDDPDFDRCGVFIISDRDFNIMFESFR